MNTAFGSWSSPLTTKELTRGVTGFAGLQSAAGKLFLLESRPEEAGRSSILMLNPEVAKDTGLELTPAPFNVRSRVHEYGGGSFLATQKAVYFVNFKDQNIYVIDLLNASEQNAQAAPPRQLTETDADRRYADLALDETNQQLIAVCEQHSSNSHEPQNLLVCIDTTTGRESELHTGHDFYSSPRLKARPTNRLASRAGSQPASCCSLAIAAGSGICTNLPHPVQSICVTMTLNTPHPIGFLASANIPN